jgi:Arc/MetJ family transcription regulator
VIGRVLRQRDARERGTSNMWMMSRKLKAIMQAQIIGDDELAEKVRRAAMPGSGEIVMSALKLLTREEASRPLVAQLAYQTTKMRFAIANLPKQLKAVHDEVSIVAYQRSQIHDDLEHLRALIQLALRLCEFPL